MKLKISCFLIFIFCGCYLSKAQNVECLVVEDTFCLITLDIRGKEMHPVVMSGVTKMNSSQNFSKDNIDSLLKNFYRHASYMTAIENGIDRMAAICMGDSIGYHYIKSRQLSFAKLLGSLNNKSLKKKIKLNSGETVFINTVIIGGLFWKVDKYHPGLSKSSNEMDIDSFYEIKDCYIPFEITLIKR